MSDTGSLHWESLRSLPYVARPEFLELARDNLIRAKARRAIIKDLDPEAMQAAKADHADWLRQQISVAEADGPDPLRVAIISASDFGPDFSDVPIIRAEERDFMFDAGVWNVIAEDGLEWSSGNFRGFNQTDPRRTVFLIDISYCYDDLKDLMPHFVPGGAGAPKTDAVSTEQEPINRNRSRVHISDAALRQAVTTYLANAPSPQPSLKNMARIIRETLEPKIATRDRVVAMLKELSGPLRQGPRIVRPVSDRP